MSPPFTFFVCEEEPPLDVPDERFDLVYACSVFTHITGAWARWLTELHRVLRPGGIFVSSVLNRPMIEPIFARQWDDRIGMAPAYLGREWDAGGPCVLLSEWWVREHWGRAFEILRFDEGVEHEGGRVGHGWVVGRRRSERPTAEQLEATDLDDPRERAALRYNLRVPQRGGAGGGRAGLPARPGPRPPTPSGRTAGVRARNRRPQQELEAHCSTTPGGVRRTRSPLILPHVAPARLAARILFGA